MKCFSTILEDILFDYDFENVRFQFLSLLINCDALASRMPPGLFILLHR